MVKMLKEIHDQLNQIIGKNYMKLFHYTTKEFIHIILWEQTGT